VVRVLRALVVEPGGDAEERSTATAALQEVTGADGRITDLGWPALGLAAQA
jgi:hypothetical protein